MHHVRKPEEARRPGSVSEEPNPMKAHKGVRRRDILHTECKISTAGAESPGLSPGPFGSRTICKVGRFWVYRSHSFLRLPRIPLLPCAKPDDLS